MLPSRSNLVVQSFRFAVLVGNHEILNLSMVSGPVFKKTKREKLDCHTFGDQQAKTKTNKFDEIGQMLVPGALNDTKKIRKVGADSSQISGLKKLEKIQIFS